MDLKRNSFSLVVFSCLFLSSLLSIVNANELEVEDESSFSYVVGADDGPQNWASLSPNWTLCGTGKSQSPIQIFDYRVVFFWPSLGNLITIKYKPAPAMIRNRGHDIKAEWKGDAGGIIIKGSEYKLQQCHWHIPSEHTINGARFNMELHIVHVNSEGDIAVVAILYTLGMPDSFLATVRTRAGPMVSDVMDDYFLRLSPYLGSVDGEGTDLGAVDPWRIGFPQRSNYYRYNGSLTTPPCSENVTWIIYKRVKTVSAQQIRALIDAVHDGEVQEMQDPFSR
ncbi:hypothetical protein OROGR_006632 [Orobanche gracilis]